MLPFACAAVAASPAGAQAAERSATPSNLASVFTSAQGGDTIRLATGNYGTFSGGSKSSLVTIAPQPGATPTISLAFSSARNIRLDGLTIARAELSGTTADVTVANSRFTGQAVIRTAQMADANIVFDGNTHSNINRCSGCLEGRIHFPGRGSSRAGVTIKNSLFSGGNTDGIQTGANGIEIVGNEFKNIMQGDPSIAHTDPIQLYGSRNTVIRGNYLHDNSMTIMAPDGPDHELIEHNVIVANHDARAVNLGSDTGSIVRHNTLIGTIMLKAGNSGRPSSGTVIKDNIITRGLTRANGSTTAEENYNLLSSGGTGAQDITGQPTFVGGGSPTTKAGFALSAGSRGKGDASDGTDRGAAIGTASTPDPTPTPNPEPTDQAAQAVWTAPSAVRVGSAVTLDGTSSKGDGPLACTWRFENRDGSTLWETRSGCSISMTFQNADTKYVALVVRDADGDTDSERKSFVVSR